MGAPGQMTREQALAGRPMQLEAISSEETSDGGMRVTVNVRRPRWQRLLGGSGMMERTFELDPLGREVYDACDGRTDVHTMIQAFAAEHKLSVAEAEMSITRFLNTLMSRGLVGMEVDRKGKHDG